MTKTAALIQKLLRMAEPRRFECSDRNILEWVRSECRLRRFPEYLVEKEIKKQFSPTGGSHE
jgi:hypothetical protein